MLPSIWMDRDLFICRHKLLGLTHLAGRESHIWRVIGQNAPYMAVGMTQLSPNCVTPKIYNTSARSTRWPSPGSAADPAAPPAGPPPASRKAQCGRSPLCSNKHRITNTSQVFTVFAKTRVLRVSAFNRFRTTPSHRSSCTG